MQPENRLNFPNKNRERINFDRQNNEFKKQSLLMIAYWFPPIKAVTLRSYYLYREWKKYFKNVTVLATSNRTKMPNEVLPVDEQDIVSINTFDYRTVNSILPSAKPHYSKTERNNPLVNFFVRLLDCFPFNILIGEGGFFYILFGYFKAAKQTKQTQPTYIYSSFRPYADHIIAWLLKKKYPHLYWIADFRDLHIDHNFNKLFAVKFQQWCNRKIINQADLVTTVSEGLAEHLRKYSPPVYVLRNGYGQLFDNHQPQNSEVFQLAYTGSIYDARQSPELLLKVLTQLIDTGKIDSTKIRLIYAGKDGEFWRQWVQKFQLDSIFEDRLVLTRQASIQLQQESQVNLLLSYTDKEIHGIITGKIYEYFSANSAIIALINGEKDAEFENIFKELTPGKLVYNNAKYENELTKYLLSLYHEWQQNGCIQPTINQEKLKDYQWENTIPDLLNYIEENRSKSFK